MLYMNFVQQILEEPCLLLTHKPLLFVGILFMGRLVYVAYSTILTADTLICNSGRNIICVRFVLVVCPF